MRAGDFATARRSGPESYSYAQNFLKQGLSYQAAAKAAGVNELTLRELLPGFMPRGQQ